MTAEELGTLAALNYLARKELILSPADQLRLFDPLRGLPKNVPINPHDPDRGYLLGLLAATDDGVYWRDLIDRYAAELGVSVQAVSVERRPDTPIITEPPAKPPVVVPPVVTPPATPPAPVGDAFAEQVAAALAKYGIHIAPNKIGVGMLPDPDDAAALHIGGDAAAVILGRSNTRRTDGQNPDEVHTNTFVVADNDGGMRWRQYLQWINGVKKRNTLNRRASVVALDSKGDLCGSHEEVGETRDGGQSWYIRTIGSQFVDFVTYKLGMRPRVLRSEAAYGAADTEML